VEKGMKIVYVMTDLGRGGGQKVLCEHISRLATRGHDAELWCLRADFTWFNRHVPYQLFSNTDQLGAALRSFRGVKVATFWVTASWVASNLLTDEVGYYLVQDLDQKTYGGDNSGSSYRLGLVPITEGQWVTEKVSRIYTVNPINVGIGLDHQIFRPLPMIREPFRVLTPYRTHTGGPAGLKGWDIAHKALRLLAMKEPRASVVTFGMEKAPGITWMPHVHVQSPTDRKLRELYSQASLFLSASRHEGFGLPHLEAMACGCPVVCTDANGNREHCRDGETAEVAPSGDAHALVKGLVEVMHDQELAGKLSQNGLLEAKRYQWDHVLDRLETAYGLHS
jgi:glycosyltransferase involved in cell wall biosynthesis